jgi:hypothetical protein
MLFGGSTFRRALLELSAAGRDRGINDAGLTLAHSIVRLNAGSNPKITTVALFAATLVNLDAHGGCGIGDPALKLARSIVTLNAGGNWTITRVAPFAATLLNLDARGSCGIGNAGLRSAKNIAKLNAGNNWRITTVAPFAATLTELDASGSRCGIGDARLTFGAQHREALRREQPENHDGCTVRRDAAGATAGLGYALRTGRRGVAWCRSATVGVGVVASVGDGVAASAGVRVVGTHNCGVGRVRAALRETRRPPGQRARRPQSGARQAKPREVALMSSLLLRRSKAGVARKCSRCASTRGCRSAGSSCRTRQWRGRRYHLRGAIAAEFSQCGVNPHSFEMAFTVSVPVRS